MLLTNVAHYLTAFVVFLKGFDKVAVPGKLWYGLVLILIGSLILLGTVFHHSAGRLLKHFKAWVMVLEAIVMTIVGYLYMKDGKTYIQYLCFAASFAFVIGVVVYIWKIKNSSTPTKAY